MKQKKEVDWSKFKEGATSPLTMAMAGLVFTCCIFVGAGFATYTFFKGGSWGLGIMFFGVTGLQIIAIYQGWKNFKFLKQSEKDMKDNAINFDEMFKNMKEMGKVKE